MNAIDKLGEDLKKLREETWLGNVPKEDKPKYTKEAINNIVNLKGHNGEQIDIFRLYGILFLGNSESGEWDISKTFTNFSHHSVPISLEEFEYCETEEDVNEQFWESLRESINEKLI